MNKTIDDEIIRSSFGDCLFLFYSDTKLNKKVIRMMDEELKPVWDRIFSRCEDYYRAVCELVEKRVHPEDREKVRDIFTFDKYTELMKDRKSYSIIFRYRKNENTEDYIYERLTITRLMDDEEGRETLVFSSLDIDREYKEQLLEVEAKKQHFSVTYALGREYSSIFYVDMETGKLTPYNLSNRIEGMFGDMFSILDYDEASSNYIEQAVSKKDKEMMRKVLSKKFILSQVRGQDHFTWVYQNNEESYCEMKCVRVSEKDEPTAVVMGFAVKDAEIRVEMEEKAQTDFQLSLLDGLSRDFEMVWLLRKDRKMRLFRVSDNPEVQRVALRYYDSDDYDLGFTSFIEQYVCEEDRERLKDFTRYDNLIKNVPRERMYSTVFKRVIPNGFVYLQLCFTRAVGPDGEENIVCAFRDVDELVKEENKRRELYTNAIKERDLDGLTGIRNRFCYENFIKTVDSREYNSLAVFYIDGDFLHELNNTRGHDAGDDFIKYVANVAVSLWGVDNTFRIGGDEFVVFDFDESRGEIIKRLDVFRRKMDEKKYSVSVGYSHTEAKTDLQELISDAEKKMFEEKEKHHANHKETR